MSFSIFTPSRRCSTRARQKLEIFLKINALSSDFDLVLVDTAAGISSDVLYFNATANEIMVVVTPEPTAITDAYALIKILSVKYLNKAIKRHTKKYMTKLKYSLKEE